MAGLDEGVHIDRGHPGGPLREKPRQRHGLVLDFSLAENLLLGQQPRYRRGPHPPLRWLIDRPRLVRDAQKLLAEHDVRPPDPSLPARALSGGNQQKLLLARALAGAELPRVLIASQPTRGVDVGAIEAIYRVLLAARDRGCAILLVSTELDELRTLCDRIVVLYRGQLASEMPNPPDAPVTRERLGELMAGVGAPGAPGCKCLDGKKCGVKGYTCVELTRDGSQTACVGQDLCPGVQTQRCVDECGPGNVAVCGKCTYSRPICRDPTVQYCNPKSYLYGIGPCPTETSSAAAAALAALAAVAALLAAAL